MRSVLVCLCVFIVVVARADELSDKIAIEKSIEELDRQFPEPAFDSTLIQRTSDCASGSTSQPLKQCLDDIQELGKFLTAKTARTWAQKELIRIFDAAEKSKGTIKENLKVFNTHTKMQTVPILNRKNKEESQQR